MQKAKVKSPTLAEEQKLWQKGYDFVVGLDEVGRGPLAGPVTAVAVTVRQFPISNVKLRGNHVALRNVKFKIHNLSSASLRRSRLLPLD